VSRSRILKAYETRFHQLLKRVGTRRLQAGVDWLVGKARRLSTERELSLADALSCVFDELVGKPKFQSPKRPQKRTPADLVFFCDAGLGGLARWLRAAGYRTFWEAGIDDEVLLKKARERQAAIVTTDSMLMERRVLRDRIIPALWLPPTLSISEQLEKVFCEFDLSVGSPRCMSCGGDLMAASKESLQDRIPPRTYRWLDEYFVCSCCRKLFWHGTHWQRIRSRLKELGSGPCDEHPENTEVSQS
jgi:uncharacterized protein with PIN domain